MTKVLKYEDANYIKNDKALHVIKKRMKRARKAKRLDPMLISSLTK